MLKKKNFSFLLTALSVSTAFLMAEEELSPPEEHVQLGSRKADSECREFTKYSRIKEREEEELPRCTKAIDTLESPFKLAATRVEPLRVDGHSLKSIADNDHSLELEDGSHWEVPPFDATQLRTWKQGEAISITPNYNWFSSYNYYITNRGNETYVRANLSKGPVAFGPQSHWIADLDRYSGRIYLENNTVWHVDPKDNPLLKDWAFNDHVILGVYDSWASGCEYILINANILEHVRVSQY